MAAWEMLAQHYWENLTGLSENPVLKGHPKSSTVWQDLTGWTPEILKD